MKRRRVAVGLVVLALVAVVTIALWPRGTRPCRDTFEQVREGMTYDEVRTSVGAPPGVYTDREYLPLLLTGGGGGCERWAADDGQLIVWFDDHGRACRVAVHDPEPDGRSWLDRFRARLGR
jgi:hypothetical protein